MVVLSAHYDSRGSFGFVRAPGGDDDGSGTGHLLAIARGIHTQNIRFHKSVVLAWFAGEEQGLLGSAYYASEQRGEFCLLGEGWLKTHAEPLALTAGRVSVRPECDGVDAYPSGHARLSRRECAAWCFFLALSPPHAHVCS
jgi:acetylornithine deacetylase/succinyl-diaminopimelate desuccinylase-like protein